MNYKPYKVSAKKTALYLGSTMAGALVIGLILFFCLKFSDLKMRTGLALEYTFDLIFVFFLFFCFTLNRVFYRILIVPQKITYEDDSEEYHFSINWITHVIIIFLSAIIFILIISCHASALHISFKDAVLQTLAINIIIFIYNIVFMYFYILILQYLLNRNEEFKEELSAFEKEVAENKKQS
jgi:hypothetical protein